MEQSEKDELSFEREKFEFERTHSLRELDIKEQELKLKIEEQRKGFARSVIANPIIVTVIATALGFMVDGYFKHIDHQNDAAESKRKSQSELLLKVIDDGHDVNEMLVKLEVLDSLGLIEIDSTRLNAARLLLYKGFETPVRTVNVSLPNNGSNSAQDTSVVPKINPPVDPATPQASKDSSYYIVVSADTRVEESQFEVTRAKKNQYPNVIQKTRKRFFLTCIGPYTYDQALQELPKVRKTINGGAYIDKWTKE